VEAFGYAAERQVQTRGGGGCQDERIASAINAVEISTAASSANATNANATNTDASSADDRRCN